MYYHQALREINIARYYLRILDHKLTWATGSDWFRYTRQRLAYTDHYNRAMLVLRQGK